VSLKANQDSTKRQMLSMPLPNHIRPEMRDAMLRVMDNALQFKFRYMESLYSQRFGGSIQDAAAKSGRGCLFTIMLFLIAIMHLATY
jgi:hypothetical protein